LKKKKLTDPNLGQNELRITLGNCQNFAQLCPPVNRLPSTVDCPVNC